MTVQPTGAVSDADESTSTTPPIVERDPFYVAPPDHHLATPGTVLRTRTVELGLYGVIPLGLTATQILYRTTNLHGDAEAAVTTVIVPPQRDSNPPPPVLSYQCAIDAVGSVNFPSYALRRGAGPVSGPVQTDFTFVTSALARGWAVSIPDHEGAEGRWGAPREPGYRVLDGLRAALNHAPLGLSPAAPIGLWGYSGGGLATAWAAESCPTYAPELNVVGAVLGSPVVDLGSVARRLNGSFFAGLAAMMISSLVDVYPEAQQVVDDHATSEGKALLDRLKDMSTGPALWELRHCDIGSFVDLSTDELFDLPAIRHVFDDTKLGRNGPVTPLLIIQGVHDEITSVDDVDDLVRTYRESGGAVVYHRDALCGHVSLYPFSAGLAQRWLADRFAYRPIDDRHGAWWPLPLTPAAYLDTAALGINAVRLVSAAPVAQIRTRVVEPLLAPLLRTLRRR